MGTTHKITDDLSNPMSFSKISSSDNIGIFYTQSRWDITLLCFVLCKKPGKGKRKRKRKGKTFTLFGGLEKKKGW